MNNLMKQRLTEAIEDKKMMDAIESYTWKGMKVLSPDGTYTQSEKRLIDMNEGELIVAYDHCKTMLYNQDPSNPGRYSVLDIIKTQKSKIGAELFIRYVYAETKMSRFTLTEAINQFLEKNKEALKDYPNPEISIMFSSFPDEFKNVSLHLIIDGCLDRLGTFNRKHITRSFIIRQGIWLTAKELDELFKTHGIKESYQRLEMLKDLLNIKPSETLNLNPKGLNYSQMRSMLNLRQYTKYSDMTTSQLETLRNNILFVLENVVSNHIKMWTNKMYEIEKVADHKNYKL